MSDEIYPWERYWCPRTRSISLADDGFLLSPDSKYKKSLNPYIVLFNEISKIQCIALLGEPGIGKSETLRSIVRESLGIQKTIYLDLRSFGSEDRLISSIFKHPSFLEWQSNDHNIYIFLDSLDECLLRIDYLSSLLADELSKYDVKRMYLRIACRTADWPALLEADLRKLWKDDVLVMELAPLTREDVILAIKGNDLITDQFIDEVIAKEAVPFAIKPVTLKFLISIFKKHGSLPSTQKEIYFKGCEILCEEHSPSHRNAGTLNAREKLSIASRIAAMTVFTNKYAVWRGIDFGDLPEEDITVQEITMGFEKRVSNGFKIRESEVEEVLATGLFTSRGLNRFGWAHQTYAEFLAAYFVVDKDLKYQQIIDLIQHPSDPLKKIVPQLHEVTAWLSSFNMEIFRFIVNCDPDVLLRSDVINVDDKDKENLVERLLEQYNAEKLFDRDNELDNRLHKLNHPKLRDQLRLYINDKTKSLIARRVATRIARACKIKELQDDLFSLALDAGEDYYLRVYATSAIQDLIEEKNKGKLRPLANLIAYDDPDDELKGIALQTMWPNHINAEELFSYINLPKKRNLFGMYKHFLNYELISNLKISDLPIALRSMFSFIETDNIDYALEDLFHELVNKAWSHLYEPTILENFVELIKIRFKYFDQFTYIKDLDTAVEKRRKVFTQLLMSIENIEEAVGLLYFSNFIRGDDFSWVIDQLTNEGRIGEQKKWVEIINRGFNSDDPSHVQLVYNNLKHSVMLTERFASYFCAVLLDSDAARIQKAHFQEQDQWRIMREEREEKKNKVKQSIKPLNERIKLRLEEFDLGSINAWWLVCWEIAINEENRLQKEFEPNLEHYKNWSVINAEIKQKIIEDAKIFIKRKDSQSKEWLGTNTIHTPALAGYKALRLLYNYDYHFLLSLTKENWINWSPVLLVQWISAVEEEHIRCKLVKMAYKSVPEKVISDLLCLIGKENKESSNVFVIRNVKECWDNGMGQAVLSFLKSNELHPKSKEQLITELLRYQITGAEEYAISVIDDGLDETSEGIRQTAVMFTVVLCTHTINGLYKLRELIEFHSDFVKEVVQSFSHYHEDFIRLDSIIEKVIADVFIWLVGQFPHNEDPNYDNDEMAHFVGPREQVAEFRDRLIQHLRNRGTEAANFEIARIIEELPHVEWLKWTLLEAQKVTRRSTWAPPLPVDIILLSDNKKSRMVQNGEQLLDVLIEALKRIEMILHGNTPEVYLLWNDLGERMDKPKTENEFSDYIKRRLEDDLRGRGIIVNREVEIRRSFGSLSGERTDIQVDAISIDSADGSSEIITVIIEIKGNWHKDLSKAMETQLVNRYLKDGKTKYGLYLVGWFDSEHWIIGDSRRNKVPKQGVEKLQKELQKQSEDLSKNGILVKQFTINLSK